MQQSVRRAQALAWAVLLTQDQVIHVPTLDAKIVPGTLHNLCQQVTRELLQVGPGYSSAKIAYGHVAKRDRTADRDFSGIPGYFDIGVFGHAVIMAGGGKCYSTDIKRRGRYDLVDIDYIERHWGARWLGGAFTVNGTRVYGSEPS